LTQHRKAPSTAVQAHPGTRRAGGFIIIANAARCCGACTRARRRCWRADDRRPPGADRGVRDHAGWRVAVLGEVYGDLLRAAGATERLMELLASESRWFRPRPRALPPRAKGLAVTLKRSVSLPVAPDQPALQGFSLHLAPGETVALVGCQRRRQEHRVPAAAALLRPRYGQGAALLNGVDIRAGAGRRCAAHWHRAAGRGDLLGQRAGEHPLRPPGCTDAEVHAAQGGLCPRLHQPCPRATTPSWASAACACPAASASASPSRAPC
jgi:hypothetical protein